MKVFFRLITLLKPQLPLMLVGAFLSVITVLANISLLAISGWFITLMAIAGITGGSVNYFTPAAVIRFLAIVRTAGRYAERMLTHRATFNALAHMRHYFYQQLEPLLPYYQIDLRSGDLLARLQQDIDNLDNFYLRVLLPIFVALISVPIVYFALLQFSTQIAWLMLTALLVVAIVLPLLSYFASVTLSLQKTLLEGKLTESLVNGVGAIRTLLVYQVDKSYQETIVSLTEQYYGIRLKLIKINAGLNSLTFLLIHLSALFCLLILIPKLATGEIDSKSLVAIILLALVSFETVSNLPLALQTLPQSLASADRLFSIVDKEKPIMVGEKNVQRGDIQFDALTFSYPEQVKPCLRDINLSIKQGEKVAIVGASGSGKSTLVSLLMGFWPIGRVENVISSASSTGLISAETNGSISIAGVALSEIKLESLRQHVALMKQHGHIFDASISDNLRLAKPNATEDEMRRVCQDVNLLEFFDSLPDGLNTWLGSTGTGLSGGQAQRLQLAQLQLRAAEVLVLDEPTKGLDRSNEELVMNNLLTHVEQCQQSLILVTHKPFALKRMDKIVVMEHGNIIAEGNHNELISSNKYYQTLLTYF
ncbi:thiol reductant ABC exporter subunit CydC [Psychrosphaera sp. B3R10]|uniref:thiol reductant ABC exporter subunit CydC n=1 Tax=unclassified Psychrosphaera TaxID=2641570 RepID=UPI001C08E424|nr:MULTISPECIES: thiol reductant ABC exporter subunit CydC [unclassified Psychrosphaera]MBU2883579.1 thiol reductant ABC exporter subunit CydC [Psychrosphaera sp. I2R16]MBU2989757.1 thiol reductant ABC exporter subunit CydC [Psychrosphaera sp. B3R10]